MGDFDMNELYEDSEAYKELLKKVSVLNEALVKAENGEFSSFQVHLIAGMLFRPPKVTEADLAWAKKILEERGIKADA